MDSTDLEREKGITILAKNTAVRVGDDEAQHRRHAGPRRLRRRGRARADDGRRRAAARRRERGAAAADALRPAQGARGAAPGRARRQQGRPARRARAGGRRRGLRALPRPRRRRVADRVPDRLLQRARRHAPGFEPDELADDLGPLFEHAARDRAGAARTTRSIRCRRSSRTSTRRRTSAGSRSAASATGTLRKGAAIAWCRADGTIERAKITELYVTEALDRVPADEAGPGEIVAIAGLPEVTIGETIADPDDPRPLPVTRRRRAVALDHARHQHLAARRHRRATRLTATMVKARLDQELVGNVSLRVLPTVAPGRVGGAGPRRAAARGARRDHAPRGLRAHGRQAGGADARDRRQACTSRSSASRSTCPEEYIGVVTQLLALRKGRHAADGQPRHRLGAAWSTSSRRAA